jgi:nitrite reductase/ring-hydroxylating ferredoxin subunit
MDGNCGSARETRSTWRELIPLHELPDDGTGRVIEIEGYRLAVFCIDGVPRVLDDECPHEGASLGAGVVQDGEVTCPWHGWHFGITDGRNTDGLAACVRVHVARAREDGMVEALLDNERH